MLGQLRHYGVWHLHHYMIDIIKIFIRAERLGDFFTLHLSCIANRILHVFAAGGDHNYTKAACLYVQMLKIYEKRSPKEIAIISSFKENGNHIARYSSNEWSGAWSDYRTNFDEELEVRRWYFRWSILQCRVSTKGVGSNN